MRVIPEFTADLSLYRHGAAHRGVATHECNGVGVTPARLVCFRLGYDPEHCYLINAGFEGYFWYCSPLWVCIETWR
jgi:hypothetical protein